MTIRQKQLAAKFKANSQTAVVNRHAFSLSGTTAISLVGSAGTGKTSLIEAAMRLAHNATIGAIVGNLASPRDAERLQRLGVRSVPVVTDNLTAEHVHESLGEFELNRCDILFIESGGNVESPVEFDFGQSARVAVFSVAGGDDKAAANPRLVADADLIVLTKTDLLPYVTFDLTAFHNDVTTLNPQASIITTAALSSHGFDEWISWLTHQRTDGGHSSPKMPPKYTSMRLSQAMQENRLSAAEVFKIEGRR